MPSNCGTVTVVPAFNESDVTTAGCAFPNSELTPGSSITVNTTAENLNDVAATAEVALFINGSRETSTTVSVGAASSTTVEFDVSFPDEGTFDLTTEVVSANRQ
jgi:subtilase family serine protease